MREIFESVCWTECHSPGRCVSAVVGLQCVFWERGVRRQVILSGEKLPFPPAWRRWCHHCCARQARQEPTRVGASAGPNCPNSTTFGSRNGCYKPGCFINNSRWWPCSFSCNKLYNVQCVYGLVMFLKQPWGYTRFSSYTDIAHMCSRHIVSRISHPCFIIKYYIRLLCSRLLNEIYWGLEIFLVWFCTGIRLVITSMSPEIFPHVIFEL